MSTTPIYKARVLTVDDNDQIHADFRRCLAGETSADLELDAMEQAMFGAEPGTGEVSQTYQLDSVLQGQDALEQVKQSLVEGDRYMLAFVDMRMPPGWDGLQTIEAMWKVDPDIQVVICTAFSDYSWEEIQQRLGKTDKLLILRKPFDPVEVRQMAS